MCSSSLTNLTSTHCDQSSFFRTGIKIKAVSLKKNYNKHHTHTQSHKQLNSMQSLLNDLQLGEKKNLQGSFSMRGAATSRRIHETIRDRAKRPQYAILADLLLIPETTVRQASQAQAAQQDARQEAAHIFFDNQSTDFQI